MLIKQNIHHIMLPLQILLNVFLCKVFAFIYRDWYENYKTVAFKVKFTPGY